MSWHVVAKTVAKKVLVKKAAKKATDRRGRRQLRYVVVAVGILLAPIVLVLLVLPFGVVAVVVGTPVAISGVLGINPIVFAAYVAAEANAPEVAQGCEVDWPIIAGIWKVESHHATFRGRSITSEGLVTPPLFGVTLDGSIPGTATIHDSDDGRIDGIVDWDRAVGPAQFLPGSWRAFGQDGNKDGIKDPHNVFDAALSTVGHLCIASPGDFTNSDDLGRALLRYNNSRAYVERVKGWINFYRAFAFTQGAITADGLYAFPLPHDSVTLTGIRRTHHTAPASDLFIPEGTPIFAAHPGTVTRIQTACPDPMQCRCGHGVTIVGPDMHAYTYCHGSGVFVEVGDVVMVGQMIMASGNTGNSEAPHLHLQIRRPDGRLVCPQILLEAWWNGIGLSPIVAPTSGCVH